MTNNTRRSRYPWLLILNIILGIALAISSVPALLLATNDHIIGPYWLDLLFSFHALAHTIGGVYVVAMIPVAFIVAKLYASNRGLDEYPIKLALSLIGIYLLSNIFVVIFLANLATFNNLGLTFFLYSVLLPIVLKPEIEIRVKSRYFLKLMLFGLFLDIAVNIVLIATRMAIVSLSTYYWSSSAM